MIKSTEIVKGDTVYMKGSGWKAVILDNQRRRNIRMAEVHGFYTEAGSIYVHDISHVVRDGFPHEVELTDEQKKLAVTVNRLF